MRKFRSIGSALFVAAVVACFAVPATAQTDVDIAKVSSGGSSVKWDISSANAGGTLTIVFPDGRAIRKTFRAGESPSMVIGDKYFESPPDGAYSYELTLAATTSPGKDRAKDDDPEAERMGRKRSSIATVRQSGSFSVLNGAILVAGGTEDGRQSSLTPKPTERASVSTIRSRIRNNHRAFFMPDQVIPDDLVVQGSACVGLDCVNNEPFNFDTLRLKENNTRILFLDTSSSAGFPTNDWIIRANSSASGGESFLGIVDHGNAGTGAETGTIIAQFDAGAPANSLRLSSTGRLGLRTATPVLDIHMNTGNTPAVRFEQNNSQGWGTQTWDIGANEANFFVRDVTSGSRLPFRIRPGAPTSSIDISATGLVGIGTASPAQIIHSKVSSGDSIWRMDTASKAAGILKLFDATGDIALQTNSTANAVYVKDNGQVGIGTTTPDQKLSVNGDASKSVGGGSWQVFSDERLKQINGKFSRGLSSVMRLQPLQYKYKPDNALGLNSEGQQVGFSAQELQKVIPEAVNRNENGYLSVNNDPILWTMLNAIKEQQQEIAELKAEVRKLRANARRHSNRRR